MPILITLLIASGLFYFGVNTVVYAVLSYSASYLIGWILEGRIVAYDCAVRNEARRVSGKKQPGSAELLAKTMKHTVAILGPITAMAVPAAAVVACIWLGVATVRVKDGTAFRRGVSTWSARRAARRASVPRGASYRY